MKRIGRLVLRALAAAALLAAVAALIGTERIAVALRSVDPRWWAAALALSIASNAASALRWARIGRALGLHAPRRVLVGAYAQAITINLLVPGATLGGDAYRTLRMQRLGNPLGPSALSVVIDRFSGLWMLAAISLAVAAAALASGMRLPVDPRLVALYGAGLAGIVALPGIVAILPIRALRDAPRSIRDRAHAAIARWHTLVIERRNALAASGWNSAVVQLLAGAALWACARAVGATSGYADILVIAAPIFIAGALPLSFAGFGAREFAALMCFPMIGVAGPLGVSAALLYGTCAVAQGLLATPLFAWSPLDARTRAAR